MYVYYVHVLRFLNYNITYYILRVGLLWKPPTSMNVCIYSTALKI